MGGSFSKKSAKAALKKHRMERPTKGQRGVSGGGGGGNNNNSNKRGSSTIAGAATTSTHNNNDPSRNKQQREEGQQQQQRGRALKISLKDDPTKRSKALATPTTRTRSGSRGSGGGASPATLNSRALHKTATVAPAPPRPSGKTPLNRFGFRKKNANVKSGESTDSVNSILSDAQTVSDSNSNIFELCNEDEKNSNGSTTERHSDSSESSGIISNASGKISDSNGSTARNSDSSQISDSNDNVPPRVKTVKLDAPLAKLNKPTALGGIAKLGATASQGRITAQTRQLPKPQIVTVKSLSPKPQGSRSQSPRLSSTQTSPQIAKSKSPTLREQMNSPHIAKSRSPTLQTSSPHIAKCRSPTSFRETNSSSVRSLVQTSSRLPMDHSSRGRQQVPGSSQSIPRMSRDSESSTKSVPEADSGIGSSSESDRIRGEAAETDTIASSTLESTESTEDMSDAWLRSKLSSQENLNKRRSRNLELNVNGTEFELKGQSLEVKSGTNAHLGSSVKSVSPPEKRSKGGKEKRDGHITYGMARQKFAPYSRNRYGYGYQSGVGRSQSESTPTGTMNTQTKSKLPNTTGGAGGLVRSRVALLETPSSKKATSPPTSVLRKSNVKKPAIRPTSLEKTPLLVMPVTERTVELSKPVCRKLEYSEGTPKDETDETKGEHITLGSNFNTLKTVAEDILIMGSIETETQNDNNILVESENHGSYYESAFDKRQFIEKNESYQKLSPNSELKTSYTKAKQDMNESEKSSANRLNGERTHSANRAITPDDSTNSSEVSGKHDLQSPDELGLKAITPQSESSFEILESLSETIDLTIEEIKEDTNTGTISESSITIAEESSELESSSPVVSDGGRKPSVAPKPKHSQTPPRRQTSMEIPSHHIEHPKAQTNKHNSAEKHSTNSLVDKKPNLGQLLIAMKSSVESKSSMDSSMESKLLMDSSMEFKSKLSMRSSMEFSRASMESSMESQKSLTSGNPMIESGELSATLSGMCTPVLTSKSDMDQDFLIDDEIADQPGLLFAGSGMTSSFFGDDGMFDELGSSPGHAALKAVMEMERSRADSVDTTSSLGGDDLMLDFEDTKMAASGYEEEVLSPDASEIFSEWTAMMAEMGGAERCVSRDGSSCGVGGGGGGGGSGGARTPRTRQSSLSDTSSPDPRRHTVLRPPRQGGVCEVEGGGVYVDRTSYQYLRQEARALKTMLLQLRRLLQGAHTLNPFDTNMRNSLYMSLGSSSSSSSDGGGKLGEKDTLTQSLTEISHENVDLRRQVVLLQQQLEEKDRTIRLLQQQLAQTLTQQQQNSSSSSTAQQTPGPTAVLPEGVVEGGQIGVVNAATQTDRSARTTLMGLHAASFDDGSGGPTVSSEVDGERCGRSRSSSLQDHSRLRFPRAASQPPINPAAVRTFTAADK